MVIGTGLVDEAYRPLIDGNHARFCAIGYQMGKRSSLPSARVSTDTGAQKSWRPDRFPRER